MRNVEKFVCLKVLDTLWQDHLSNMEHMRDSVRLRAYGGKDPLVEYKNEGHRMFGELLKEMDFEIAQDIMSAGLTKPSQQINTDLKTDLHRSQTGGKQIGRNDPCPCGSGKKWKNCGLINAPEHKK